MNNGEIVGGKGDLFSPGDIVGVRVGHDDWQRIADQLDARFVVDYGAFVWVELETADLKYLRDSGVRHTSPVSTTQIVLGDRAFDTRTRDVDVPSDWQAFDNGPDLQIVQLIAPTKARWLSELRDAGLEVVAHVPPHSYVVWADPAKVRSTSQLDFVRWTQPFHPEFRVRPVLRSAQGAATALVVRGAGADRALQDLAAAGGTIRGRSVLNDQLEIVDVDVPADGWATLARVPGVFSLEPVPTDGGLRGEMSAQINVGGFNPATKEAFPGYSEWLTLSGINGDGVTIANVDGGVLDTHPDLAARIVPCTGTTCGGTQSSSHGTHTAGIMAGDGASGTRDAKGFLRGQGVAPKAKLVEQVYSGHYTQSGGMLKLMTESHRNGALLSGNSWGPAGSPRGYDHHTLQVDVGVRDADPALAGNQPFTFVLSIMNGNGGTSSQGTPDEAKNIITVGSTKLQNTSGTQQLDINNLGSNSAHGPALDGRKIPHLVAPGCSIDSTTTGGTTGSWTTMCGTSMASPQVTGAAALFIQHYRKLKMVDPSPALIKAAVLATAIDLGGNRDADGLVMGFGFNNQAGWGRLDVNALVRSPAIKYFDNPLVFQQTGEEWNLSFTAADPTKPVRLMLVWTDAPGHGLGGSTPAWNNDLDLEVTANGAVYGGNSFNASGFSVPQSASETKNNTEGVVLTAGTTSFSVRVVATNLTSDAIPQQGSTTDQDFALVCVNCAQTP